MTQDPPDLAQLKTDLLAALEVATSLDALEAVRVHALGKNGVITGLLKTLGAMSPEERKSEGPRINGLRSEIAGEIDAKKAALQSDELDSRIATESIDLSLPPREAVQGSVHPVSQVMDELAEIFADLGFAVATGPRSRTTGTISPRSTSPKAIRRGRCTTHSTSPRALARMQSRCCCARIPRRCKSAR